jgi:hypothetical protein
MIQTNQIEHDKKLAHDIAMVLTSKLSNSEPLPLDLVGWYNVAIEKLKEGEKG